MLIGSFVLIFHRISNFMEIPLWITNYCTYSKLYQSLGDLTVTWQGTGMSKVSLS